MQMCNCAVGIVDVSLSL